jgi:hypothetical protein
MLLPRRQGHGVLPKLAYLTLRRSIQLLSLLARGDRQGSGDPGATPPAHRAAPPAPTTPAGARRSSPARREQPRAAPRPLVLRPRQARDAAALAPAAGRRRLDLPASPTRTTLTRHRYGAADRPLGQGEPLVGLPAHPGRAAPAWCAGLRHRDPYHAAPQAGPRAAAAEAHTYQDAAGHRVVLLRADRLFPTAVGARYPATGATWGRRGRRRGAVLRRPARTVAAARPRPGRSPRRGRPARPGPSRAPTRAVNSLWPSDRNGRLPTASGFGRSRVARDGAVAAIVRTCQDRGRWRAVLRLPFAVRPGSVPGPRPRTRGRFLLRAAPAR